MSLENITLGYACINQHLRELRPRKKSVCVNRTCRAATYKKRGKSHAIELAKTNLIAVIKIIEWNESQTCPIRLYRMSSNMFPHLTNPEFLPPGENFAYSLEQFSVYFNRIGELAERYHHRLTFHPGQYNQIGTPHSWVFEKTKRDLLAQATVLDMCSLPPESVMVVHGGGVYSDKPKTLDRWIEQFRTLPKCVQGRIVVENCERHYNYMDMLYLSKKIKRPFIFDTHHHACYSQIQEKNGFGPLKDPSEFIDQIVNTWVWCNIKPKFHISEQNPDKKLGAHSDYVENIPQYLFDIASRVSGGIDIMVEAKEKERAVQRLQSKYSSGYPR